MRLSAETCNTRMYTDQIQWTHRALITAHQNHYRSAAATEIQSLGYHYHRH